MRGAVVWYAVHGTSLRNSFTLASGDNKGVASWLAETALRSNDGDDAASSLARCRALIDAFGGGEVFDPSEDGVRLAVQAPSVAAAAVALESSSTRGSQKPRTGTGRRVVVAFPQGASGDISPNVRGARRVNDPTRLCDEVTGAGDDELKVTGCAGLGPAGADDAAGCVATGAAQAAAALKALTNHEGSKGGALEGSKGGALEGSKGFRSLAGPVRHTRTGGCPSAAASPSTAGSPRTATSRARARPPRDTRSRRGPRTAPVRMGFCRESPPTTRTGTGANGGA